MVLLYLVICEFNLYIFVAFAKHEQYNGHSLYQINVNNRQEIEVINNLVNQFYLDVLSRAVPSRPGQILVPKESKEVFEISLNAGGIKYEIKFDNIKELLQLEEQQLIAATARNQRHRSHRAGFEISFNVVYTYDEINDYLQYLAKTYSYVENVNGGVSFEKRPIYYLKISTTNFQDNKKPIVMLQSLIHAREWTSSPVTLYAIHNLVTKVESDLLNNIDWIIVPVVNPDGYVYSHKKDRLWRKNKFADGNLCHGVDLNRNFNVTWGKASNDYCSEVFQGKCPSSEPETRVVSDIITMYKNRIHLFLDLHNYGSMILYGNGNGTRPKNYYALNHVGVLIGKAIDNKKLSSHPNYIVGNIERVLYAVSGCASDFAQEVGIPLAYSIELPGSDDFFVNNETMEHTCFETWQGIAAGARYILNYANLN